METCPNACTFPRRNGTKKRALGLPTWSDKLLQEVIRLILDAYFEPSFSDHSHGFRPHSEDAIPPSRTFTRVGLESHGISRAIYLPASIVCPMTCCSIRSQNISTMDASCDSYARSSKLDISKIGNGTAP